MPPTQKRQTDKPPGYDCPRYAPAVESKRCLHYRDGGACALAAGAKCVEWLKANGQSVPAGHPAFAGSPGQRDLFGRPVPSPAQETSTPTVTAAPEPTPEGSPSAVPAGPREPITQDEIDSFKALAVEVCIRSEDFGALWLVPAYTRQERKEITPEHAATLRLLLDAFPGARVTAFEKLAQARAEELP
jgi:hypothetical protein